MQFSHFGMNSYEFPLRQRAVWFHICSPVSRTMVPGGKRAAAPLNPFVSSNHAMNSVCECVCVCVCVCVSKVPAIRT
jgi:hypothetical protein